MVATSHQRSPLTPASILNMQPLSPSMPYPAAYSIPDTTFIYPEDCHLEEVARYGRKPRVSSDDSAIGVQVPCALASVNTVATAAPGEESGLPAKQGQQLTTHQPEIGLVDGSASKEASQDGSAPSPTLERKRSDLLDGQRSWDHGLFDCFKIEPKEWVTACFLPCVTFAEVRYRTRQPGDVDLESYNKWCNGACWGWFCLGYCTGIGQSIWTGVQRNSVRQMLGIRGNGVKDCLVCSFCLGCELCQELHQGKQDRELLIEQKRAGNKIREGYAQQAEMAYRRPVNTGGAGMT